MAEMKNFIALILLIMTTQAGGQDFASEQQQYPRVRQARLNTEASRDSLFNKAGLAYPTTRLFIRAFKHERILEIWVADSSFGKYKLIKVYRFTSYCGDLGPKRQEGDLQIPEGFYHISQFNPASSYHLSLKINYPNKSDRKRAADPEHPGGLIYIHGNRVTIGCIPLGDQAIEELYIICVDSKSSGQDKIPVHIFPCRFDAEENAELIKTYTDDNPVLKAFWDELNSGYEYFENTNLLPDIKINNSGRYLLQTFVD